MAMSRPASLAQIGSGWVLPTLQEILADIAPPPWTLTAFMAYLSQNHCLETLEFTMEAERYRNAYIEVLQTHDTETQHGAGHLSSSWQRLIHAYIQPSAYREVNLPSHVRDHLLSLPYSPAPPHPSELDEAVRIIYDLMNDSVLIPFLESTSPIPDYQAEMETQEPRHGRSRTRLPKDPQALSASRHSPKSSPLLAQLGLPRRSEGAGRSASSSTDAADHGDLTDDSDVNSPPAHEPMTPPTTPPTSDWGFATSPGTLQKAISAHNSGWKKVGAKLGFSRKSRTARGANASGARASDAYGDSDTSDSYSDSPL